MITVSNHERSPDARGALVDRGANGGVAGADARLMRASGRHVDITGIDNHKIKNVAIGTCGGVVDTDQGKVIVILHECAILGKGKLFTLQARWSTIRILFGMDQAW